MKNHVPNVIYPELALNFSVETTWPNGVPPQISVAAQLTPWRWDGERVILAREEAIRRAWPDLYTAIGEGGREAAELQIAALLVQLGVSILARSGEITDQQLVEVAGAIEQAAASLGVA